MHNKIPALLSVTLVATGCFAAPAAPSRPLAEAAIDLSRAKHVGVVAFSSAQEPVVLMPRNKADAAQDASDGIRLMRQDEFAGVARSIGMVPLVGPAVVLSSPLLFPAISAIGGSIDTVQTWVRADSEHRLAPSREALQAAVAGVRLHALVRERVSAHVQAETDRPITVVDDATVRAIDPYLRERAWRNDASLSSKARQALAERGIDRLVEIRVHAPGLAGPSALNPNLAFTAQVQIRVVTIPAGAELYRREANYYSVSRHYEAWAANGGEPVRDEIMRCVDNVATKGAAGIARRDAPARRERALIASVE